MLLREGRPSHPFGDDAFVFEVKFDGYRLMAGVEGDTAQLMTRGGAVATRWFPEVANSLTRLGPGRHVLDGKVIVQDDIGRSDFDRLHARARRRRWYEGCDPVVFCAFDVLVLGGRRTIDLPLEERKQLLRQLLTPPLPSVMYVEHFEGHHGAELYSMARTLRLEGLVAKRRGSHYYPGERSSDWIKWKVPGAVPAQRFQRARASG